MKRMLLMLLPLLCLAGTGAVHAQKWQLKIGGGLASQGVHNRVVGAYKIGVAYEYEFDQHWTFSPGLMFYGKGWRTPDESVACVDDNGNPMLNESGQQVYSLMSRSASANYVEDTHGSMSGPKTASKYGGPTEILPALSASRKSG